MDRQSAVAINDESTQSFNMYSLARMRWKNTGVGPSTTLGRHSDMVLVVKIKLKVRLEMVPDNLNWRTSNHIRLILCNYRAGRATVGAQLADDMFKPAGLFSINADLDPNYEDRWEILDEKLVQFSNGPITIGYAGGWEDGAPGQLHTEMEQRYAPVMRTVEMKWEGKIALTYASPTSEGTIGNQLYLAAVALYGNTDLRNSPAIVIEEITDFYNI